MGIFSWTTTNCFVKYVEVLTKRIFDVDVPCVWQDVQLQSPVYVLPSITADESLKLSINLFCSVRYATRSVKRESDALVSQLRPHAYFVAPSDLKALLKELFLLAVRGVIGFRDFEVLCYADKDGLPL